MLQSPCEVEVSTVYTLKGVTSKVPPQNETSTGKSEHLFFAVKALNLLIVIIFLYICSCNLTLQFSKF